MRIILVIFIIIIYNNCFGQTETKMNYNKLSDFEKYVIIDKGTEAPFSGEYYKHNLKGFFICKHCDSKLFKSEDKFDSGCGWPSFDDEIDGAIKQVLDADGKRTEIVCSNCGGHLGHVFFGESFTQKNKRHCVNSVSLQFIPEEINQEKYMKETAYIAGGCFWGIEYHMKNVPGVLNTQVGYMGGKTKSPNYNEICSGETGHAEAVKVSFNPELVSFEKLCKLFFEIHDPTTINRQGPDIGTQYRSEIFYTNEIQKEISENLIKILKNKGYSVVTRLSEYKYFYIAEDYHQDYYNKSGSLPYCHFYRKKF